MTKDSFYIVRFYGWMYGVCFSRSHESALHAGRILGTTYIKLAISPLCLLLQKPTYSPSRSFDTSLDT